MATNLLIDALPPADGQRLLAACEQVALPAGSLLARWGEASEHLYFPTAGSVALVVQVEPHPRLALGMVGREGLLGLQLALGERRAPAGALVQAAGQAWRIARLPLGRELARSSALRRALDRCACLRLEQLATASACLRFHQIGPRLARWLLMSLDRSDGAGVQLTQALLASLLGVRRVGITVAAGRLQRAGLIRYHRGELTVLDRPGLEAAACSCYAADRRALAWSLRSAD